MNCKLLIYNYLYINIYIIKLMKINLRDFRILVEKKWFNNFYNW